MAGDGVIQSRTIAKTEQANKKKKGGSGGGGGGQGGGGGGGGGTNPLAGLLNTPTKGRLNMSWKNLTPHERRDAWGRVNDIYMRIYGRAATMQEAQKVYNSGLSNYALGQQLMMSKEFVHTALFHQLKRSYVYEMAQFMGGNFKLNNKLVQSFAAHQYSTTDLQAWVYRHPHVYMQSNDFKSRVAQMRNVYAQTFGVDPSMVGNVTTNAKQRAQGQGMTNQDPLLAHIQQAALHFNTADQYQSWLMTTQKYKHMQMTALAPGQDPNAGLTLNANGRPVQQALGGKQSTAADVGQ